MPIIRVGKVPGTMKTVALEDGATVADALRTAELDASGFEVRRNGSSVPMDAPVSENDNILLTRQIKGNQDAVTVRLGKVPGTMQHIALEAGATVEDALEEAGLDASGFEVRVNGSSAPLDRELNENDNVLLTRQIKGN